MEAVLLQNSSSPDHQARSPNYKHQIRKPNKIANRSLFSRPHENLAPPNNFQGHGGPSHAPPPSLQPPPFSLLRSFTAHPVLLQQQQQLPPLLPLPTSKPLLSKNNYPHKSRGLSRPPNRRRNRSRDQPLTPKKSDCPKKIEDDSHKSKQHSTETEISSSKCLMNMSSTKRLGPEPEDLRMAIMDVSRRAVCSGNGMMTTNTAKFSGSVAFTISPPPPSSLPLPTFTVRTKLSCNARAAPGIDAGATDNLQRLLRLRPLIG